MQVICKWVIVHRNTSVGTDCVTKAGTENKLISQIRCTVIAIAQNKAGRDCCDRTRPAEDTEIVSAMHPRSNRRERVDSIVHLLE